MKKNHRKINKIISVDKSIAELDDNNLFELRCNCLESNECPVLYVEDYGDKDCIIQLESKNKNLEIYLNNKSIDKLIIRLKSILNKTK